MTEQDTMDLAAYDAARSAIQKTGFTPVVQTKISSFWGAAKNTNAAFLWTVQFSPLAPLAQQWIHSQYFHELEASLLLGRVTRWDAQPRLYAEAMGIAAPLWEGLRAVQPFPMLAFTSRAYYQGLALGHALFSQVRLTPAIPANASETDPYVAALRRIEQDDARMLQTQIALLRVSCPELPPEEKEIVIEEEQERVRGAFLHFLQWLSPANAGQP
jgi:hypothetical protein